MSEELEFNFEANKPPPRQAKWLPPMPIKETTRPTGKPPVRRHYALTSPMKKVVLGPRRKFRPDLIDATLFLVDPVRPYPEWPLICRQTNKGAFQDDKALKSWYDKVGASIFKTWKCDFCGMLHADCLPHDVTGESSGKNTRKQEWIKKHYPQSIKD